jgi:hypothetical protein
MKQARKPLHTLDYVVGSIAMLKKRLERVGYPVRVTGSYDSKTNQTVGQGFIIWSARLIEAPPVLAMLKVHGQLCVEKLHPFGER